MAWVIWPGTLLRGCGSLYSIASLFRSIQASLSDQVNYSGRGQFLAHPSPRSRLYRHRIVL